MCGWIIHLPLAWASSVEYFVNSDTCQTTWRPEATTELSWTQCPSYQQKLPIHVGRTILMVPVKSAALTPARGCLIQILSLTREAAPQQWGHHVMCTLWSPLNWIQLLHLFLLPCHGSVLGQEHRLQKCSEMPLHLTGTRALQCQLRNSVERTIPCLGGGSLPTAETWLNRTSRSNLWPYIT